MKIRLLKRSEINEVAKLFVESYKKESKSKRWELDLAEKYILMQYRISKDLCFVAVDNDKIVGVCLGLIVPEFNMEYIELKTLLVHPEYRRQKIASGLVRKICIKAENKYNIREIEASMDTLINFPITWFESIGFRTRKHFEVTRASIENVLKVV